MSHVPVSPRPFAAVLLGALLIPVAVLATHSAPAEVRSVHEDDGWLQETDRLWRLSAPADAETRLVVEVTNVTARGPVPSVGVRVLTAWGAVEAETTRHGPGAMGHVVEVEVEGVPSDGRVPKSPLPATESEAPNVSLVLDLSPGVHWLVVGTDDADARYHVRVASDHYGARVDRVGDAATMYRFLHSDDGEDWQVTRRVSTAGVLHLEASAQVALGHGHNAVALRLDQDAARFTLTVASPRDGACTAGSTDAVATFVSGTPVGLVETAWTAPSMHDIRADVTALATDVPARPVVAATVWDLGLPVPGGTEPLCSVEPLLRSGPRGPVDEESGPIVLDRDVAAVLP